MSAITSGSATAHPLFDLRAIWHGIGEFAGAALAAFSFAAIVWMLLAVPGLFS